MNLPLKFGQNRASDSCDIADIEFRVVVVGGGGGGVKSFSCKTQTFVRLGCGWVGVLSTSWIAVTLVTKWGIQSLQTYRRR